MNVFSVEDVILLNARHGFSFRFLIVYLAGFVEVFQICEW